MHSRTRLVQDILRITACSWVPKSNLQNLPFPGKPMDDDGPMDSVNLFMSGSLAGPVCRLSGKEVFHSENKREGFSL